MRSLVLPSCRSGRRWAVSERRFLTRVQLGRLLTEIPPAHQPLFVLLASTGLRISEAIALRWYDLDLDASPPRLWVRRAIVHGVTGAPKSYHGARTIPLAEELAGRLRALRPPDAEADDLVFPNRRGQPLNPNNIRNRVLKPAAERAGVSGIGLHALRHTCASLLIEEGASPLRLQRWMGHHAAAYTLDTLRTPDRRRARQRTRARRPRRPRAPGGKTGAHRPSPRQPQRRSSTWRQLGVSSPAIVVALTPGRYAQVAVLSCACQ